MSDTSKIDALLDEIKRLQKEIEREREDGKRREEHIHALTGDIGRLKRVIESLEHSLRRDPPRLRFWIRNRENHNEQFMANEESPSYYIVVRTNPTRFEVKEKACWEPVPDAAADADSEEYEDSN